MLKEANQAKYFPRGKPKIFLFIDDLDRCSPKTAVEVLEAIQLLLNTKKMVTMITIDLRHMERCLEQNNEYKGILREDTSPSCLHYLEKILQLAYRIPPIMEEGEMELYFESQLEQKKDQVVNDQQETGERDVGQKNDTGDDQENESQNSRNLGNDSDQLERAFTLFEEDVRYMSDDIRFTAKACSHAGTSLRNSKRVLSSFKILNEIWTISNDIPEEKAKCACVVLLAICASNDIGARVEMEKAFWKLERDHNLLRPSMLGHATFISFWKQEKGFLCHGEELSQPI